MSKLEVDAIEPQSGTTLTIGASGDSVNIASGATITDFTSTGIDDNATSTAITIDSNEVVRIGNTTDSFTATYTEFMVIGNYTASQDNGITFLADATNSSTIGFTDDTHSTLRGGITYNHSGDSMTFTTFTGERMRIDSSGNLLVGVTSTAIPGIGNTTAGVSIRSGGNNSIATSRDSDVALYANRITNDGNIVELRKDGTLIGSLGSEGGDSLFILSGDTGLRFSGGADVILPCTTAGAVRDNAIDLGNASARFDDIWATNGTIQTSDQNEKQSIQSLTTAEMNVAKSLSSLIKTFKWNSAVEKKGDSARTHTGIIAQDVQQAFADEGLDASNYALFLSNTWWEKEISVDAVQAVQAQEATYDEEGNELTPAIEAVEAKDAYTYIDTKEEATEGYTEKTKLGVRYPELLSFIQAYNDQRFTALEARITTLENK